MYIVRNIPETYFYVKLQVFFADLGNYLPHFIPEITAYLCTFIVWIEEGEHEVVSVLFGETEGFGEDGIVK